MSAVLMTTEDIYWEFSSYIDLHSAIESMLLAKPRHSDHSIIYRRSNMSEPNYSLIHLGV